jgi:predicted ribosomally synthesized peptide with SipW-like signal peptide
MKLIKSFFILFSSFALIGLTTNAYFSDTVIVSGNEFQAGTGESGHVVINEVYYDVGVSCGIDGVGNSDEWVELYNPTSNPVDLKDWTLTDNDSATTINSNSRVIPALGFALISKDAKTWTPAVGCWSPPANAEIVVTGAQIGNGLENAGDRLILKDTIGNVIDAVSWGSDKTIFDPSAPVSGNGKSIQRNPVGTDTDTAVDWVVNTTPSPGAP